MKRKFKIDFFEFSFLVEACIPPRPIARSMFWDEVCDTYYHEMTPDERIRLFEWIPRNPNFKLRNEQCAMFYARFNPKRQYLVHTEYEGKKENHETYKLKGTYYTSKGVSIYEKYIVNIEPII